VETEAGRSAKIQSQVASEISGKKAKARETENKNKCV